MRASPPNSADEGARFGQAFSVFMLCIASVMLTIHFVAVHLDVDGRTETSSRSATHTAPK